MKKIVSTILVAVMCFTYLVACKKETSETSAELTSTTETIISTTSDSVTTTTSTTAATTQNVIPQDQQGSTIAEGEAYSKDPSKDDVLVDEETGIMYVKNQLLISCNIGTPKEEVEKICEEIDAEIVGYIELTSDFQIEFKEDHSIDQLQEAADSIESHPFVLNVTLNMVEDITVE